MYIPNVDFSVGSMLNERAVKCLFMFIVCYGFLCSCVYHALVVIR